MITTTISCDAMQCTDTSQVPAGMDAAFTVSTPSDWITLRVEQRSWPFGSGARHFCSWTCVAQWSATLAGIGEADTNDTNDMSTDVDVDVNMDGEDDTKIDTK